MESQQVNMMLVMTSLLTVRPTGQLDMVLMPLHKLGEIMATIQPKLDARSTLLKPDDLAGFYQARITRVGVVNEYIVITTLLPILDKVTLYRTKVVQTLPYRVGKYVSQVIPQYPIIVYNEDDNRWTGLSMTAYSQCLAHPLHDCRTGAAWIILDKTSCESSLLTSSMKFSGACRLNIRKIVEANNEPLPVQWVLVDYNSWLISVPSYPQYIRMACWHGRDSRGEVIKITVNDSCVAHVGPVTLMPRRGIRGTTETAINQFIPYGTIYNKLTVLNWSAEVPVK